MKILYGVQGTGNGHITRARMMAEVFSRMNTEVDYIFSGKDDDYFNMEVFGDYRQFPGLSFVARQGEIQYLQTLHRNKVVEFVRDVKSLDIKNYDLVLNDFEPITAWAARINKVPCISVSHQNAFRYRVPVQGNNPVAATVMKWFAPADIQIGLHWHHFDQPLLPPMIKTDLQMKPVNNNKILVYLPFIQHDRFHTLFNRHPDFEFIQYHPIEKAVHKGNILCKPLSRDGFLQDFSDCCGLISSAGFGACSEAMHYGKKLLVLPLNGQMEQLSNAAALQQLGYGTVVMDTIKRKQLRDWLHTDSPEGKNYPDVASAIATWLAGGQTSSLEQLSGELWKSVKLASLQTPSPSIFGLKKRARAQAA